MDHLRSLIMAPFDRSHTSSYSLPLYLCPPSFTIFELKRDSGRKTPIFHIPLYLTCTIS